MNLISDSVSLSPHFSFITLAIFVVTGVAFGSFLNVVLMRFRTASLFGKGDSVCLSCGSRLKLLDLIPVFSYLGLKGQCRKCGSKFSSRYFLVEIVTACLFGAAYALYGATVQAFIMCGLFLFLVLIVFYDLEHKIIPDEFSIPFNILAFASIFVRGNDLVFSLYNHEAYDAGLNSMAGATFSSLTPASHVLNHLTAGIIAASIFFFIWRITKGRGMGFADWIVALGMGFVLGMPAIFTALTLAFWIGAVISVGILLFQKLSKKMPRKYRKVFSKVILGSNTPSLNMKSEVPFGPFLAAGFIIQLLTHANLF